MLTNGSFEGILTHEIKFKLHEQIIKVIIRIFFIMLHFNVAFIKHRFNQIMINIKFYQI